MRFVVVVDTQRDFMLADGALSVAGAEALVEPLRDWLAALRPDETAGVLFTFDTHEAEAYAGSPEAEAFPLHCVRGSAGWENVLDVADIDPVIPVWRIEKGVFDMWAEEGLAITDARDPVVPGLPRDRFFEDLKADGVREVAVIGVAADYCVRWAIEGLLARGFHVVVPAKLTRGIDRQIETVAAQDFAGCALSLCRLPASIRW